MTINNRRRKYPWVLKSVAQVRRQFAQNPVHGVKPFKYFYRKETCYRPGRTPEEMQDAANEIRRKKSLLYGFPQYVPRYLPYLECDVNATLC
jgi:hypothetical protein